MEGDVPVELLEEWAPVANHARQYGIAKVVGQPAAKAFAGDHTASHEPDAAERGPQAPIHELREIAGVEVDGLPDPRQLAAGEDEGGLVAVRPPQPSGFEPQRGLIGP